MTTRLVLNHWQDWLEPGSPNDLRLLHADSSDRILVCPSHLGQGYIQEIPLQDDLTLFILDYTLNQDVVIDAPGECNLLEFTFHLASLEAGYSFFCPYFGDKKFEVKPARKRFFKVEVFFKHPALTTYFQAFMERLSPHSQDIVERVTQWIYRYQEGHSISINPGSINPGILNQILNIAIPPALQVTFEQLLTDALYAETIALNYVGRNPITAAMKQAIGQILSCPYQGATRRAYLECKALNLVGLHLDAMMKPRLSEADQSCIYQAASILRNNIANPPTMEALARHVGTNRFKLNQGFHQVYGVTPFGYLRDSRLMQAQRLLMISDLSIVEAAAAVGYTSRSRFATAFRQKFGINPKAFQMQAWQMRQLNCAS